MTGPRCCDMTESLTDSLADERRRHEERDLDRLVLFSDAVVAIAITLLALEIKLPDLPSDAPSSEIASAVGDLIPNIITFAWSFIVVAAFWSQHRHLFGRIDRVDRRLFAMNTVFLLLVALLPFPSDALGRFDVSFLTVSMYTINVAGIAIVLGAMALHTDRNLVQPGSVGATIESNASGLFYCAGVFLGSLAIAAINPRWAPWTWWLFMVFVPFLSHRDGDSGPRFGRWHRSRRRRPGA